MRKPWQTKEWIQKRKEYLIGKNCEQCNSEKNLVIHHPQKKNSLTTEGYTSFKGIIILCNRCHLAHHKGMNLCPECKKKYKKMRYDTCWNCKPEKDELEDYFDEENSIQFNHHWCGQVLGISEEQVKIFEENPNIACIEQCSIDINICYMRKEKMGLLTKEDKLYVHPGCNQKFLIKKKFQFDTNVSMYCIEHCFTKDFNSYVIAKKKR